jgi:hypothetical protein
MMLADAPLRFTKATPNTGIPAEIRMKSICLRESHFSCALALGRDQPL